jgi:hypothetical protein
MSWFDGPELCGMIKRTCVVAGRGDECSRWRYTGFDEQLELLVERKSGRTEMDWCIRTGH